LSVSKQCYDSHAACTGDAVAYALWIYASNEKLSPSTKESIERLVENFTIVQDYREITVNCHRAAIV